MSRVILILLYLFSSYLCAFTLNKDAPSTYIVQDGDTIWVIASKFLKHPWEWQALLSANNNHKNPSKLYPGDIIELHDQNSNPYIVVMRSNIVKLSRKIVQTDSKNNAIPTVSLTELRPFLNSSLVIDQDALLEAPYIVAFPPERLLGGQGDEAYVKGLKNEPHSKFVKQYAIYRRCSTYRDPKCGVILGYRANLVAYAQLLRPGKVSTILITDIKEGVRTKDRVMPNTHPDFDFYFALRAAAHNFKGIILDILGDYKFGAKDLAIVINKGRDANLKPGDVVTIYSKPRLVSDPKCKTECLTVPPELVGEAMVFRVFSKTSFALVMRSTRDIKLFYIVKGP